MTRGAVRLTAVVACALFALGLVACKRHVDAGATPSAAPVCVDSRTCAAGETCVFSPGLCGRGPSPGTCRPRPASCAPGYAPVCGCDGKIYDSACAAQAARVDLDVTGRCKTVIPDWAPCGARYCDVHSTYCEIYLSDVFELPTTYTCRPLPASCRPGVDGGASPATCDCFPAGTPCHAFCGPLPTGGLPGFHLTCQGVKEPRR